MDIRSIYQYFLPETIRSPLYRTRKRALKIFLVYLFNLASQHPTATKIILTAPLSIPHIIPPWIVLKTVRRRSVREQAIWNNREQRLVKWWLIYLLLTLTVCWFCLLFAGSTWLLIEERNLPQERLLAVSTSWATTSSFFMAYCYLRIYHERPPKTDDWLAFIAANEQLKLKRQYSRIRRITRLKL